MPKIVAVLPAILFVIPCLLVFPVSSADIIEDSWASKAIMPAARSGLGVAVVDGKIYAIGGYDSRHELSSNNEMYYPITDNWTKLAPMPTARARFGIAVCENKVFVIGGVVGVVPSSETGVLGFSVVTGLNEVYDPVTNIWENKASMPTARGGMQANVVNGKIYVTGGFIQQSSQFDPSFANATEVYDPVTDSWSTMASMPICQEEFASAAIDEEIFIISDKVQIFNTATNQWSLGNPPPKPVYQGAAGATIGIMAPKRIYVMHGGTGFNQIYDPVNDSWTTGASLPNPELNRLSLAVAVVDDMIYAIGGSNTNPGATGVVASNDQYVPIGYGTITESAQPTPNVLEIAVAVFSAAVVLTIIGITIIMYFKRRTDKLRDTSE
jgi:N-acetylneuraminic acid mutarotase